MTAVISYSLVLSLASGVVPLAGVSVSTGETLPVYHLRGTIGPVASIATPVYRFYLPVVRRPPDG